jgi:uncharacterized protein YjbI with pentapeptide repeats
MTTDAEDRSLWPRNGKPIRRADLLRLIEDNHGPEGLDLRGARLLNDGRTEDVITNAVDLSPNALQPLAQAYREANGGRQPLWLAPNGGVALWDAQLEAAYLARANLQNAVLAGTNLRQAKLSNATLNGANLSGAHLQGTELLEAELQGANVQGAGLQGADLSFVRLEGADLSFAQFQRTFLGFAQLERTVLLYAELQGLDMYHVDSLVGARWYGAHLDHTLVKRDTLGKAIGDELEAHKEKKPQAYERAKEAYLLLKNNFNQIGRYEDASWAYVKEQQMEKMAHYWEWRSRRWQVWRAWGSFWRWLRNWAYELATGYGERPWNPIIGGLLAILGFAGGLCATRAIANFWDALVYSIATFATFNLARPSLNPEGRGAEIASSIEAILGISVLALVIFTLGNRMSRG